MSNGLTTTRLEGIGPVRMCKRVLKSQTSEKAEIPFFKISTFGDKPDTYIEKALYDEFRKKYSFPKKGDILISAAGTVGKTVIYDGRPAYFQDSNIVWIENDESKLLNKYLYYFYQTKPWQTTNGSTIKRIYNDDLKSIKISFNYIPYLQKVASVLSALDDKIELNNKINAELEQMAKTLYDYWFVQFDFPDANSNPYKSSGGTMVYNEDLKREIPKDWEVKKLSDIEKNIVTGKTPSTTHSEYFDGTVPFITIDDIRKSLFVVKTEKTLSKQGANTQKNKYIPAGSICVTCIATPGLVGFASIESQTNQQINSIVINNEVNKYYLYFAIKSYFDFSSGAKSGNTFANMNKGDFESIQFLNPEKSTKYEFHNIVSGAFLQIHSNQKENQKLAELRDWLLPMLMNGQVTVR